MAAIEMEESHDSNTSGTDDADSSSDSELNLSCSFSSFKGENKYQPWIQTQKSCDHIVLSPLLVALALHLTLQMKLKVILPGLITLTGKLMCSKNYRKSGFKYCDARRVYIIYDCT